jgi:hypothetical protein
MAPSRVGVRTAVALADLLFTVIARYGVTYAVVDHNVSCGSSTSDSR